MAKQKLTVTAAEGVRAQVTIQKRSIIRREIPEVRASSGVILAGAKSEEFVDYATTGVVMFASEAREFEIEADESLIVELQPEQSAS